MSLEMQVFLRKERVPAVSAWQAAVTTLGIALELDPQLNPLQDSGFSPSKINGNQSGFEIYSEPAAALLAEQPRLTKPVADRDWCISFRWGGDLKECACVLGASAALVKTCDAVAYYPDDDLIYSLDRLLDEAKSCL